MPIMKFSTVEEVIKRANATCYGLAAGVNTTDIEKAIQVAHGIRAGSVWYEFFFPFTFLFFSSFFFFFYLFRCPTSYERAQNTGLHR